MAKRKVTMLEAFQASAKESAERAAAERRRVVAERERELRREEAARAAQEIGHRLGAGAISSWISGLIPADEQDEAATDDSTAGEPGSTMSGEADERGAATPPSIHPINETAANEPDPAQAAAAIEARKRAQVASAQNQPQNSAQNQLQNSAQNQLQDSAQNELHGSLADPVSGTSVRESVQQPSAAEPEPKASAPLRGRAPSASRGPAAEVLETATAEEIEEAMSAIDDGVFALPITPRAFAILLTSTLVAVFLIGLGIGRRTEAGQSGDLARGGASLPNDLSFTAPSRGSDRGSDRGPAPGAARGRGPGEQGADAALSAAASGAPSVADAIGEGGAGAVADPGAAIERGLTLADQAFLDPAMKFTIMAITYASTEVNRGLALETYDLLDREGFPVIQPVDDGVRVYVFVGASESIDRLSGLCSELSSLRSGRSNRHEFRSAYVVNIDTYR